MLRSVLLLLAFLVVVVAVGGLLGYATAPGDWYAELEKPPFNPPSWLFGPVWLVLYVCVAVAGWRTFMREPRSRSMLLWYGQMALNWLWSPVFFSLHLW
jgi:tryptophan-rich sensory protein